MTMEIVPAISPTPIKFAGITLGRLAAMVITPEMVNPEGPTEMNMPGRRLSLGSFCVINRYKNAEYTISETMNPIPCSAKPPTMICSARLPPTRDERRPACGPMTRRG